MSSLTIENISPQLYAGLEQIAAHRRRSLTQQALWFLEQGLMRYRCEPVSIDKQWLEPIKPFSPISSESMISMIQTARDDRSLLPNENGA